MLLFPMQAFMNYESCYLYLLKLLHPNGLHCPCGEVLSDSQKPHKYRISILSITVHPNLGMSDYFILKTEDNILTPKGTGNK